MLSLRHAADGPAFGVEALVRWRHPQRGVIPPAEFIPVAEDCALINELSQFVLDTASWQFVQWQLLLGDKAPRFLAVNLSRAQLQQPGYAQALSKTLQLNDMDPRCLQLEVTETLAAQDEVISDRLRELKALGLTLALDDFGTGYSSLSSLHELPVDTVKIDRSFVQLADSSPRHRVLIEATVRVANSLGMGTVAEGVETEQQASMVSDLGCDRAQGYLFSRPLEAADLTEWALRRADADHRAPRQ